jgi:hypothetical protein
MCTKYVEVAKQLQDNISNLGVLIINSHVDFAYCIRTSVVKVDVLCGMLSVVILMLAKLSSIY